MARDGNIVIGISVDGKEVEQGRKSVKGLGEDAKGVKGGTDTANKGIKEMALSLGLVKIGAAAFKVLAQSMDAAISRFDTFQTFPKVMDALGESAEASQAGIDRLSDGIDGLPTKLDDIVSVTQRMYASFNNLDDATDTALALNNALLASGASAADASRGTDQYIQGLQKGKFELEEWKTLQETMTIGLFQIAESFGMTERELKSALDSGKISMDEFNNRMIELGTGTGTLAELAKENSKGIATSLSNLRNTAARGLADILTAFNDLSVEVTGSTIAEHIDSMKVIINSAFRVIGNSIRALSPVVILLAEGFGYVTSAAETLSPVLLGLAAAYTALMVIQKVQTEIAASRAAFEAMSTTIKKITVLTQGKTIAEIANTKTQGAYLAANLASLKGLTAKNVIIGLLTGQLKLSTAATLLKAKAVTVLSGVLKVLSGPIGWVVAGIGALVAGSVALVKWLNRSTEEGKRLAEQSEQLGEATNELTSDVEANQKGYEKQVRQTEAATLANTDLVNKIDELSSMENLNSKQKKELQDNIEMLNQEVAGLNVAYDEEAKALSMSSDEMRKRVDLMAEEEKYNAAKERQLEITKEQHEVDLQLKDVIALRELAIEQEAEGSITRKELKDRTAELDEQEQTLKETLEVLAVQYGVTEEAMTEAMENQTAVAKTMTGEQIILYEALSESLQGTVDEMKESYQSLQEAATNAFTKIDLDTEHTMASMIETLQHNQKAVEQWGDNQAKVMKWAGENGYDNLLPYIESMGIDSAAELAVMANSTDAQMTEFANLLGEGAEVGSSAFSTSIGEGGAEAVAAVEHLVDDTGEALSTRIKAADFPGMGGDVSTGMAEGVEKDASKAVDAAGNMAEDMVKETKNTLKTQSPSRVFKGIGEDTVGGLTIGILDNTKNVVNALKRLALQMPPIFNHMPGQFTQIGQQVMNGLNNGLISGRGRVLNQARSIANAVTSTMQRALRIQSPSGVMRDDIGRWIPEGVAEGIDANAKVALQAIDRMSDNMARARSPEMVLGGIAMGGMPTTSNVINNYYDKGTAQRTRAGGPLIHIDKIENYSDSDVPQILEQSAWIMDREGSRLDD